MISQRHVFHAFGLYKLPIGTGMLGGQNEISRAVLGGWQIGTIFTYGSGTPIAVTSSSCTSPGQGQCMPNVNPAYTSSSARITGGYGRGGSGRTACNLGIGTVDGTTTGSSCTALKYIDSTAFAAVPNSSPTASLQQLLGNAPRTGAFRLTNPASTDLDANLKRTIKIHESVNLQVQADCINVLNHTIFSGPNASFGSATFGQVSSVSNKPRSFAVAAKINF